jgi:phosphodiesterase/alkaline phosphatase D-like protein
VTDPLSTYLVSAQGAATHKIVAWVAVRGATNEDFRLTVGGDQHAVSAEWLRFPTRSGGLRAQRITIDGLAPGREYPLRLLADREVVATANATTLPERLPLAPARPFTVLLASCFSVAQDPTGLVGAAADRLPAFAHPDVTILAGDQVYLDSPFMHFLTCTHSKDELAEEFLARYVATWTQRAPIGGFQKLLNAANTFFSSDDHDFWNNAPNAAPYARDTWTAGGRAAWTDTATRLFHVLQGPRSGEIFSVGSLSFFVADTRMARTEDRTTFMSVDQLTALSDWVRTLEGPGVLVTGQPIFVQETGWTGGFTDYCLADYRQYADLVRILASTPHDLVVLTGDVHFGRVATCVLPSGRRLLELVSSPLALVHPLAAGKWHPAAPMFPSAPVPGVAQAEVATAEYQRTDEHFVTAGFTGAGAAVQMTATAWPIRDGTGPLQQPVVSTVLH